MNEGCYKIVRTGYGTVIRVRSPENRGKVNLVFNRKMTPFFYLSILVIFSYVGEPS